MSAETDVNQKLEYLRYLLLSEYRKRGVLDDERMLELSQNLDKLIVQVQRGKAMKDVSEKQDVKSA